MDASQRLHNRQQHTTYNRTRATIKDPEAMRSKTSTSRRTPAMTATAENPNARKKVFETEPKSKRASKAKPKKGKEDELFEATKGVKEGTLRKALKLPTGEKFNRGELARALKTDNGGDFSFKGNKFKMTPLMKKRINLAVNMM